MSEQDARLRLMPTTELMEAARKLVRLGHHLPNKTPADMAVVLTAEAAALIWVADELSGRSR